MKEIIPIKVEYDIVHARQAGRKMAKEFGFSLADQTRLATAISEITRNALQYAGSGTCTIKGDQSRFCKEIQVLVEDNGPGICDISKAMEDGYSTGNGLGAGLPGTKRLMHAFLIESRAGYTRVEIGIKRRIF